MIGLNIVGMLLDEIRQCIRHGRLDEGLQLVTQLDASQELPGRILQSRILERKGEYYQAFEVATKALETSQQENRKIEEIGARIARAYTLLRLHRYQQMHDEIEKAMRLISYNPTTYEQIRTYEATLYNIQGIYHRWSGNLDRALEYYETSLDIRSKLNLEVEMAISLTNIGTVYQIKGDLDLALEYHREALETFEKLGDELLVASCLHDMGRIFWQKAELSKAVEYYEQAVIKRRQQDHLERACQSLLDLVQLSIEKGEQGKAKTYYNQLEQFYLLSKYNRSLEVYQQLAEASILKHNSRIIDRANAQKIFQKFANRTNIDFQLVKFAMLNLCDLLLMDLKISRDEAVIEEVEQLLQQLLQLAKDQQLNILMIETYFLQSKLALINLDLEQTQYLLSQAELVAHETGLTLIAQRISLEHDRIMDRLKRWDILKKKNAPIMERVEVADFEQTIDELLTPRQLEIMDPQEEIPQFLLILNEDALTLYSHRFQGDIEINEQLIGGFLMATNFRINQALDRVGETIERIKYGTYNMIFMKYRRITFCYAFEGQSYYAVQRLSGFIDRIKLSRSWDLFDEKIPQPRKIRQEIQDKVETYFLGPSLFSG